MIDKQITIPFAYDFDRALLRLASDPVNAVDMEKREIRIPMEEGNIVNLRGIGSLESPSFILENAIDDRQVAAIHSIFHFDRPLDTVVKHFEGTDLEQIFRDHAGTPLIRSFSLYGTLMQNIIHQQLNLAFAHTLTSRFVETFGSEQDGVWRYPNPERIAALEVEELRKLQFSGRKAEYIIGLSRAIVDGKLDLEKFLGMDDEEVMNEMIIHRGIGPWTAQNFLMFGLGRPNLFPLADIGLQNALKRLWGLDRKPTADEMHAHFPSWTPYLSYAALYLWRSIE